jgi:guanylate kinase
LDRWEPGVPLTKTVPADGEGAGEPRNPLIFVIFGAGGVGKGTLVDRLLKIRDGLWLSRSWTTRPRRPSEPESAYVFATRDEFMARMSAGGFVEWTEFAANGQLYGTPTMEPPDGSDVVLEIDLDGASQVKRRYPAAVLVFISVPSVEVQAQRLRRRGDDEASIEKRLLVGAEEERLGRAMAEHVVVNDDVERAAAELAGIIDICRQVAR